MFEFENEFREVD